MSSLSRFLTSRLKIGLCARLVALGRAYLGKPSRDSIHRRLEPHDTVPLPMIICFNSEWLMTKEYLEVWATRR